MRIHLIRHGQTDWNREKRVQGHSESLLTPLGQEQARLLAPVLKPYDIRRVYCSSSQRTRQTAELLFAGEPVETSFHDELREIFLGPWEGHLQSDIRERYPESFEHFWQRPEAFRQEGAEHFEQTQARGLAMLKRILSQQAAEDVAIVSHGVLIKSVLCALEDRPLARLWEPPVMHNCAHSIVVADPEHGRMRIEQFAGTPWPAGSAATIEQQQ
ncbi:MAG: histidine phosphatase family protein [Pseudomonadales bacterium]|nr:histidine phosphatase family protein [Pseudomonadales bacterium]MCP5358941.1 histidine phosphatase family protein [Pseudomonadales bacterium]